MYLNKNIILNMLFILWKTELRELQLDVTMWLIAISDKKLESCQRVTQTAFGPPFKHAVNQLQLN